MIASFPPSLKPPAALEQYFRWLESVGAVRRQNEMLFALVDPDQRDVSMFIEPVDPDFAVAWLGDDNLEISQRFAAFVRTGGDGSYAALWLDDEGHTKFVHHGSGSGSTLLCTWTEDPVDFLRLLAIGYDELCWSKSFDRTPDEVQNERSAVDLEYQRYSPPWRLRARVEATFGVNVPQKAADIVSSVAEMDDDASDDPFWNWIRALQSRDEDRG